MGVQIETLAQIIRNFNCARREVDPNSAGATPGPTDCVGAELAHQVQQPFAGNFADLIDLVLAQLTLALAHRVQIVP